MTTILLDAAARFRLVYWLASVERPPTIPPATWQLLLTGCLVSVPIEVMTDLSEVVGGWLVSDLRNASELAAEEV